jgi:hypothetical protein
MEIYFCLRKSDINFLALLLFQDAQHIQRELEKEREKKRERK